MFPWFFVWSPQVFLPLSGSVAQQIEPNTNWFIDNIDPSAGDARIEQQAFGVASYGRQLGLISEVLLDLAAQQAPSTAKGQESLARIADIHAQIGRIKDGQPDALIADITALVHQLKGAHAEALPQLKQALGEALADG